MTPSLLLAVILLTAQGAPAKAKPAATPAKTGAATECRVCTDAQKAEKTFTENTEKGIDAAVQILEKYQGSKNADLLKKEIDALLKLSALTLPKNDEGQIDDYLYDIYRDHKTEMDESLKSLGEKDRKIIQDSLDHMAKVSEDGNG